MERASVVIRDILQEVQIQASEQPIEAVDSNTVIRFMNRYMSSLAIRGASVGWTNIVSENDFLTIPEGLIETVVDNTAKRIANSYDVTVSMDLAQRARESEKALFQYAVKVKPTQYPDTLPTGSGNYNTYCNNFYSGTNDNNVAAETNRDIGLEDQTDVN